MILRPLRSRQNTIDGQRARFSTTGTQNTFAVCNKLLGNVLNIRLWRHICFRYFGQYPNNTFESPRFRTVTSGAIDLEKEGGLLEHPLIMAHQQKSASGRESIKGTVSPPTRWQKLTQVRQSYQNARILIFFEREFALQNEFLTETLPSETEIATKRLKSHFVDTGICNILSPPTNWSFFSLSTDDTDFHRFLSSVNSLICVNLRSAICGQIPL